MVNIPKFFKNQEPEDVQEVLPLLPLRDIVVFPHTIINALNDDVRI